MNNISVQIVNVLLIAFLIFLGFAVPLFGIGILVFIGVILLLFFGIQAYVYFTIYWMGIKFRRTLKEHNRVTTLEDAKRKYSEGQGTIIIEAPTAGWNVNRLWWCPDSEITKSKYDFEDDYEDFIAEACENYDKYISEKAGIAKLFDIYVISQRTEKYLTEHFGHCDFCFVPSAIVWVHRKSKGVESTEK